MQIVSPSAYSAPAFRPCIWEERAVSKGLVFQGANQQIVASREFGAIFQAMSGAELMGFVLTGMVMLFGLIGTLLPGIPGAPLILAAAIGHKLYFGSDSVSYLALFVLVILTILSMALDFLGSLLG